jgi:hypothetical protein
MFCNIPGSGLGFLRPENLLSFSRQAAPHFSSVRRRDFQNDSLASSAVNSELRVFGNMIEVTVIVNKADIVLDGNRGSYNQQAFGS